MWNVSQMNKNDDYRDFELNELAIHPNGATHSSLFIQTLFDLIRSDSEPFQFLLSLFSALNE